ncbi:MAG: holo-ACP synthase [Dethiobacteria bacterium]|nr:holo-ACP synthase [Bacillota bacterium]MDW7729196.1 holo-ACP synthase [Bacillota bacterium]
MNIQIGVDLVSVTRIEQILKKYPDRFTTRILSDPEKDVFIAKGARTETLAAAFAAKEAVLKAIGCGIGPAALNEVEVLSATGRQPSVLLHGTAARIAGKKNITGISISMTHEPPFACAVAVAYKD